MRDVILILVIAAILPAIVMAPHIGALAYAWLSLMNPHRLTYGFSYGMPFATWVAGTTVLAWLMSSEPKLPRMNGLTWLLIAFTAWICLTTALALEPEAAFEKFDRTIKILASAFVTLILITRRERIIQLAAVVAGSIAFFGVKGGLFTIVTAGGARIWGPPLSMIEDNNSMALALVMVVPLIYFLSNQTRRPWLRLALMGVLALCLIAILGTQSRGGMLSMAAMGLLLWWRSQQKLVMGIVMALGVAIAGMLLSGVISQRLDTLRNYEEDASAQSRFNSWRFAMDVALEHPVTGGGFLVFVRNIESGEGTDAPDWRNAHSIYFETLGEHGFVGLFLFVGLIIGSIFTCHRIRMRTLARSDLEWAHDLATALQISLIGFSVGGAFLNMAFYDLNYYLFVLIIATDCLVRDELKTGESPAGADAEEEAESSRPLRRGRSRPPPRSPVRRRQRPLATR
ncbi:MAG: putative O-glycosylation ligase, exosortase A system-associated [Geminicoccaceae bacterium]|nr:putative O-glycosylation ligase, exosortase A system-associated [Geminicoccaceae bacterium]